MQAVPITTKVVNLNPAHGEVYLIQQYVIKVFSDLWQVGVFFPGTLISSTSKTDCHHITEILLKLVLNTYNPNSNPESMRCMCVLYVYDRLCHISTSTSGTFRCLL